MPQRLEILTYPNPLLREVSKELQKEEFHSKKLKEFSQNLLHTMYESLGIGLAAVQVGCLKRIIAMDTSRAYEREKPIEDMELSRYEVKSMTELEKKISQPWILINPKILEKKGSVIFQEGCLSVPSYFESVKRAEWIRFEYYNIEGEKKTVEVDGLISVCVQHEIDHLDGKIFIDRLSTLKGQRLKHRIKKYGYPKAEDKEVRENLSNK